MAHSYFSGTFSKLTNHITITSLPPGLAARYVRKLWTYLDSSLDYLVVALHPKETNRAPLAVDDHVTRPPGRGFKVRARELTHNDLDLDGAPLSVSVVSSSSERGGAVQFLDGWIHYQPPQNLTEADYVSCTIVNPAGKSATSRIHIDTVPPVLQPRLLTSQRSTEGKVRVSGVGIPGRVYLLQYTDDPVHGTWQTLLTVMADAAGAILHEDSPPEGYSIRHYRAVAP